MTSLSVVAPIKSSSQTTTASDPTIRVAILPTPSSTSLLPSPSSNSSVCHSVLFDLSPSSIPPINFIVAFPVDTDTTIFTTYSQPSVAQTTNFVPHHMVTMHDLIVTGRSNEFIASFILQLSNAFAIKNLGKLHYFLGIEVHYQTIGLTLSQSKYIRELLGRAKMDGANAIATPMATIDLVLQLRSTSSLPLQAFSNADSVGCPDDQRSTNAPRLLLRLPRCNIFFKNFMPLFLKLPHYGLANIFTKSLLSHQFNLLSSKLAVVRPLLSLQGHVRTS
ncbi:hypothetical protein KY285_026623 [Solanum tuberosum]|nr:hypothetical protein KY285_026623 [Solanum tuberosum]